MLTTAPSLEEIIGQLFLLGFKGESVDPHHPIVRDISRRNLGGVILFDRLLAQKREQNNIVSPAQVKELVASLQGYASSPLLVTVDQEGGMVQRLKARTGFPESASAADMAAGENTTLTSIHAARTASSLQQVGINWNLAPVVDLDLYPENPIIGKLQRSFSSNPEEVVRHAAAWMKEHEKLKVLSCIKHFPGHGSSRSDSHLGFTDISASWQEEELTPFRTLIKEEQVDSVMLGHLFHEGLDPRHPTSLSAPVIDTLLRKKLGFEGVVISDDLQMKAITDNYTIEEAVCLALAAGIDMLIIGNNLEYDPGILQRLIPVIITAVEENRIPESRIYEAWQRVRKMKERLAV
ncbi:MAG: glycoside hydrolase family 3 N-terminal domain-containing protein [Thermodesulfobacteriota bacterium]